MTRYVHRTGEHGRPVVLLHPLALSGAVWDPVAAYLGTRQRVLAPDARGHGKSGWDGAEFTVADMAADAAAVIEEAGDGPADVIGLSMGGSTALVLAATRPELVHRLVLADATACYGPNRVAEWAERAERAERVPRAQQLTFQRDRWFAEEFRAQHPEEVERVCDIFLATDSAAHAAACRALGALDATGLVPQVRAETLILVGEEDYATPPAMAEALAAGIPGSRLEVLARTRHLSLLERPDLWPAVAAHLAG
ncbi:alpha/beta fold hydrolase [Amycolatopsis thermophila]|uniref:3-oxoadipate enol-lactonase n=1 Tax=Amycolatopsis thermophila TaxID=206084 RepID=A0ABU0EYS1_9PSEU|nr:alpha/beta fold hydrolase [Amycolatopsis thermophila]MDQ0380463.1 3-oxoadipate enol-lactonase [Amycolatopsis thermophila]